MLRCATAAHLGREHSCEADDSHEERWKKKDKVPLLCHARVTLETVAYRLSTSSPATT
jgi:hypothetical protein